MSHIHFSLKQANGTTYRKFIEDLRTLLTGGTSHGIPVLRHSVQPSVRFILIDLSNNNDQKITVAIDVVNVYVVGYCADNRSYFLEQDPNDSAPIDVLFPGAARQPPFRFTGHYSQLERAYLIDRPHRRAELKGREVRELISLGIVPLHEAITNLRKNEHVAEAFLVIIQMIAEAARFKYIEVQLSKSMDRGQNLEAGPAILGIENNWGALSTQIQQAGADGKFKHPVDVETIANKTKRVDNVNSDVVKGVALIRYEQVTTQAGGSKKPTGAGGSKKT